MDYAASDCYSNRVGCAVRVVVVALVGLVAVGAGRYYAHVRSSPEESVYLGELKMETD